MNAWDHLPNAKHIDRVLASLKTNPKKWAAAYDTAYNVAWAAAYNVAWSAAYNVAWSAAYDTVLNAGRREAYYAAYGAARNAAYYLEYGAARNAAWSAAWGAIAGLIAYDDCAHMLVSTPDELRVLHALGDERAILFIPAAIVFSEENITEVV